MKEIVPEFSHIVDTSRLPAKGAHLKLDADDAQKRALEKRLGLEKINSLSAQIEVRPLNKHQVRVSGSIEGVIAQTCVVTLKSFDNTVKDDFSVLFEEESDPATKANEIDLEFEDGEDRDVLENHKIDVGELVVEYFSLAIDPFPHAPNAVFQDEKAPETEKNAFSVLEKLKKV